MAKQLIGQQGEVRIIKIEALPQGMTTIPVERDKQNRPIISHSESGHHHVLPAFCEVMERTDSVPAGMKILHAIVSEPASLIQTAAAAHHEVSLPPGVYEFRISREFDPFAEQSRRVAD